MKASILLVFCAVTGVERTLSLAPPFMGIVPHKNLHSHRSFRALSATLERDDIPTASSSSLNSPYENFDYYAHWYPVIWAHELRLNEPTKVTVFDVDYVVARIAENEVIALVDQCPHKAAALSQGRVTSSGHFQCAYHGWSFDGTTGDCVEIPQIVKTDGSMPPVVPAKSCAQAIPVQIHQQMVWLFPGGGLEAALQVPPPPTVKEVDDLGFSMSTAMRDMPVDWPIVVSNICDPDHGLFAHQAKPFDMYSASRDYPFHLSESFPNDGKGWILEGQVDATEKLLQVDRTVREEDEKSKNSKMKRKKADVETPIASTFLQLPTHLQLKRINKTTNSTSFVGGFFICPVGVGRTRFMSAGFSKKPPKSWMTKLFLDNFLDQDTYLLATQEHHILKQEAKDIRAIMIEEHLSIHDIQRKKMPTRHVMFCLSSPSEKFGAKIEQFWDATLLRVPNRVEQLLQLDAAGAFIESPTRQVVLDRKSQHLDICPSAQDVVRNCEKVVRWSFISSLTMLAAKIFVTISTKARLLNSILQPWVVVASVGLSAAASFVAKKIKIEYFFKYTDEFRRKDLSKIPKEIWTDK